MKTYKRYEVRSAEDIVFYLGNIMARIAVAMLREHGYYRCVWNGTPYEFVVKGHA